MNIVLQKIKNMFSTLKNSMFGEYYRLVIWSEKMQTNQVRLEVLNINNNFEHNNNVPSIYYICNPDDYEILSHLTYLKNKYKICEIIETNYKFKSSQILTEFIITKSDKLLFQDIK